MHILLCNDDGYASEGLRTLCKCLEDTAVKVTVVAPDRERSVSSNALTTKSPLKVKELRQDFYIVNGTPADCAQLALTGLLRNNCPNMIISGINHNPNLGDDVLYSGTVAAAMEGRFLELPAIAVSAAAPTSRCLASAGRFIAQLVNELPNFKANGEAVLNVNVPDLEFNAIAGTRVTRLGSRNAAQPVRRSHDRQGREIYWIGEAGEAKDNGPDTDFYAVSKGYISVSPLSADMTNRKALTKVGEWLEQWQRP